MTRHRLHLVVMDDGRQAAAIVAWLIETQGVTAEDVASFSPPAAPIALRFTAAADWVDERIAERFPSHEFPHVVALTSLPPGASLNDLSPVGHRDWSTAVGMLVLAYPELHWLFCNSGPEIVAAASLGGSGEERLLRNLAAGPSDLMERLASLDGSLTPLFDRTGLRNHVRWALVASSTEHQGIARRRGTAAAIDEERAYAWLNAYIGYRFGYLADSVTTLAGMEGLNRGSSPPSLVFEDLCVEFPDDDAGRMEMSRRYSHYPWLEDATRIWVTSAPERPSTTKTVNKPLGGIFQVWHEAEIPHVSGFVPRAPPSFAERLEEGAAAGWNRVTVALHKRVERLRTRYREVLSWLGFDTSSGNNPESSRSRPGHATHGRIMIVAERLVDRARRRIDRCETVPCCCHGAVLATDAFELLAGRTPTLALDALSLKHQFEVLAECQFMGVRHHIELKTRLLEISEKVAEVTRHHGAVHDGRQAALNAELAIIGTLTAILRNHSRFDEEQHALSRIRWVHREIMLGKFVPRPHGPREVYWVRLTDTFKRLLEQPVRKASFYLVWIMETPSRFFLGITGWLVALGIGFAVLENSGEHCQSASDIFRHTLETGDPDAALNALTRGFREALETFLSIQPSEESCVWGADQGLTFGFVIIAIAMVAGLAHLGVLVSHIYSLMARR